MAGEEMIFATGPPQAGHFAGGASPGFWSNSNLAPQLRHRYS
jgi:hypothetical protein